MQDSASEPYLTLAEYIVELRKENLKLKLEVDKLRQERYINQPAMWDDN